MKRESTSGGKETRDMSAAPARALRDAERHFPTFAGSWPRVAAGVRVGGGGRCIGFGVWCLGCMVFGVCGPRDLGFCLTEDTLLSSIACGPQVW